VSAFTSTFDLYWRTSLAAGNDPEVIGTAEGDKAILDPENILTDQEFAGLIEFGEYCTRCHVSTRPGPGGTPPLFTNFSHENIGVPANPENRSTSWPATGTRMASISWTAGWVGFS
jgi:cytochrome c peroxidase